MVELRAELAQLRRQSQQSQAAQLATQKEVAAAQASIVQLQAAVQRQDTLSDKVSLVAARQEQQARRQQLAECQRGLLVRLGDPLPPGPLAPTMQKSLTKQLGVRVTVHTAQQLGQERGAAMRRNTAYKVLLGSAAERLAVLKVKAASLRGTSTSIDVLLTPDQLARKQRLLPVARQAKQAGRRVQWRFDALLVDGKPYDGPGSLPLPSQQQGSRSSVSPASQQRQHGQTGPAQPHADADGFQPSKAAMKKQRQQLAQAQAKSAATAASAASAAKPAKPAAAAKPQASRRGKAAAATAAPGNGSSCQPAPALPATALGAAVRQVRSAPASPRVAGSSPTSPAASLKAAAAASGSRPTAPSGVVALGGGSGRLTQAAAGSASSGTAAAAPAQGGPASPSSPPSTRA